MFALCCLNSKVALIEARLAAPSHIGSTRADSSAMLTKRFRVDRSCAVDIGGHRAADCGVNYPTCPNLYFEGTSDWDGVINEYYTSLAKPLRRVEGKPSHNQYRCDDGLYFFHESATGCEVEITASVSPVPG